MLKDGIVAGVLFVLLGISPILLGAQADVVSGGSDETHLLFSQLKPRTQEILKRRIADFVWIGDEIWSIEVKNRWEKLKKKKVTKRSQLEPYENKTAPRYCNIVTQKTYFSAGDVINHANNGLYIRGRILQVLNGGMLINQTRGALVFLESRTEGLVDSQWVDAASRRTGNYSYASAFGSKQTVQKFKRIERFDVPVKLDELVEYLQVHAIKSLPFFKPRKVRGRGSKWVSQPYVDSRGQYLAGRTKIPASQNYYFKWTNRRIKVDIGRGRQR